MTNGLYVFDIGYHNEQIHAYINVLNALVRKHKREGRPVCATERMDRVNELTEAYFAQVGLMPKEAALDRLSYLVLFDELTDNHPDKVTREEFPIMSDDQLELRQEKYRPNSDMQYGDRRYSGRRKVHFTDDNGSPQVRNSRIVDHRDPSIEATMDIIDLYDALANAGLTDRQREAIDMVYFMNMTQEEAAEVMGVSHRRIVGKYVEKAIEKLRFYMENGHI